MYSPRLLEHFEHPRNAGVVREAQASAQIENPACGDVLKLTAMLTDEIISEIRFQAQGCVPAIACGSALTELVQGKTLAEASALTREDVVREVGGVPAASSHAAQLAIDALGALLASARKA
jgi:nitrogen fixation protein NifU and related proteins